MTKNIRPVLVVAVLVRRKNKFLLVKETLEDGKDYWIVPGGKVEFSETIEEDIEGKVIEAKWFTKSQALKLNLVFSAKWLFEEVV